MSVIMYVLKNIVIYINKIVHFYELLWTIFLNFSFIKYSTYELYYILYYISG